MVPDTVQKLNDGLGKAMAYDNIAILVLMLMVAVLAIGNIFQFVAAARREKAHREEMRQFDNARRDDTDKLLKLAFDRVEVDNNITTLLSMINEKVSHVKG